MQCAARSAPADAEPTGAGARGRASCRPRRSRRRGSARRRAGRGRRRRRSRVAPVDSTAARSRSTIESASASETPEASYVFPSTSHEFKATERPTLGGRCSPTPQHGRLVLRAAPARPARDRRAPLCQTARRTLARRGTPVARWRPAVFGLGIALVAVSLVSPIASLGEEESFAFHMVQHLLLGDLGPLCIVAGLTGPDPAAAPVRAGGSSPALPGPPSRRASALDGEPLALAPAGSLGGGASARGRPCPRARVLLHGGRDHVGGRRRGASRARSGSARPRRWATSPPSAWSPRFSATSSSGSGAPFYGLYQEAHRPWGLSASADQGIAGGIMMVEGSLVTIGALAWLFLRLGEGGRAAPAVARARPRSACGAPSRPLWTRARAFWLAVRASDPTSIPTAENQR